MGKGEGAIKEKKAKKIIDPTTQKKRLVAFLTLPEKNEEGRIGHERQGTV